MTPDFTLADLLQKLQSLTPAKKFLIAYSGGLDSHVLLHMMSQLSNSSIQYRAIHIHHGLQKVADDWESHCQRMCDDLNLSLEIKRLGLKVRTGESVEEIARRERYKAFSSSMSNDEVLLTAHHQNDQAETLLLQLFRGAGVQGLAAMPEIRQFGSNDRQRQHLRPFLNLYTPFFRGVCQLSPVKLHRRP